MPRLLIILILTIVASNVNSQSPTSNELIAEGGAKLNVKPDIAIFTLTIEKSDGIENNAIKFLNLEIEELVKSLNKLGFTNRSIKVAGYGISSLTDNENRKKYTASNILRVEFQLDNKLIDAFYNEIQDAAIEDLDVSFDTRVSDSVEKASRLRLVQLAIKDAIINANNISKALNIKIIRVKRVQKYVEGFSDRAMVEMAKFTPPKIVGDEQNKTSFDKFQVEDNVLEEKITIVYEISK